MKILAIGHSVEDRIHLNENETISPGGIFYTALGLNSMRQQGDELYLLTSYDEESRHLFESVYKDYRRDYFQRTDKVPRVNLYVHGEGERCENYENLASPLSLAALSEPDTFDGILLNMITGSDVTLEELTQLRKNFSGLIYLDVHTLSRGVGENNHRFFRPVPDAPAWLKAADIVQVNESELLTLSQQTEERKIASEILDYNVTMLIITKGEKGNRIYWREEEGEMKSFFQNASKVQSSNKVGCGDIFGAVFFYSYISRRNLLQAARRANIAAGLAATYSNINEFRKLRNDTIARFD